MRPLLAYASDSSDSEYEIASDVEFEQVPLTGTDWGALSSICAQLDRPGGPSMFNTVDYNNACQTLEIGPNSLWFGVYRILGELKLGKPISWSSVLQVYKNYQIGLQNRQTSSENFKRAKLAIFFNQWRSLSSLHNVLMAQCYAFEVNNLLVPAFSSWRQQTDENLVVINDCNDIATQFDRYRALEVFQEARAAVARYRTRAEGIYATKQQRRTLAAMISISERLGIQLNGYNRHALVSAFANWRCYTHYTLESRDRHRTARKSVVKQIAGFSHRLASDANDAALLERHNSLEPRFNALHMKSQALQHSTHKMRQATAKRYFNHWIYLQRLEKQSQALNLQIKPRAQLRSVHDCLVHWKYTAPLQIRAKILHNTHLARHILLVWRLELKGKLLRDSWGYRQVVQVLKYWYLKCSAEVYLQYREHTFLDEMFNAWKSQAESRWVKNEQVVTQVFLPHLIADSFVNISSKLKHRLELLSLDSVEADVLSCQNSKQRGVTMLSTAVSRVQALENKSTKTYTILTGSRILRKWRVAAEQRRLVLLEQSAEGFRTNYIAQLRLKGFLHWKRRIERLNGQLHLSSHLVQRQSFNHWRQALAFDQSQMAQAQSFYEHSLKHTLIGTIRLIPDLTHELESRCALFQEINSLALEQAIFRRIQIRLVRIQSQEAQAFRFYAINIQGYRKRLLRHWYSKAVEPQAEPMTPRSARRLPPNALRRIIQESRKRPGTTPGTQSGSETPSRTGTRVNRKLFFEN